MTDPVPDPSRPVPSLPDVFRAFTPAATDPDALMQALKASEMPSVPPRRLSDAIKNTGNMRWCQRCARPEPKDAGCPNEAYDQAGFTPIGKELPADPFTPGRESGVAAALLFEDMVAGGIPVASVEAILGHMLAALIRDAPSGEHPS